LLEQGTKETVVLQGSHVGIRKKVRAFSQSATQKARMQVSLLSIGSIYDNLLQQNTMWELACPDAPVCQVD
jgi:hypothetical protein